MATILADTTFRSSALKAALFIMDLKSSDNLDPGRHPLSLHFDAIDLKPSLCLLLLLLLLLTTKRRNHCLLQEITFPV